LGRLTGQLAAASKLARARLGVATGGLAAAAGIAVQFGVAWALMAGGAAVVTYFLVLYDVDERRG
jgi:hypothetical protein